MSVLRTIKTEGEGTFNQTGPLERDWRAKSLSSLVMISHLLLISDRSAVEWGFVRGLFCESIAYTDSDLGTFLKFPSKSPG